MRKSAVLSPCRTYRYSLWRNWGDDSYAMFIGLNPSTADEVNDDNTIRRCVQFAKDWGYGGLCMTNLFSYRATKPKDMKKATDPIGPDNNRTLIELAQRAGVVVAAWGTHGLFMNRGIEVVKMIPNLSYLKLTKELLPAHPLYLPKELRPIPWGIAAGDRSG